MKEFTLRSISSVFIVFILLCFIYSNNVLFDISFLLFISSIMSMEWSEMVSKSDKKNKWFIVGSIYILITVIPLFILKLFYNGSNLLMWLFLLVWSTDTFAYIVGAKLNLGKHKINKISPKKSYEGLIGGILASLIICGIFANFYLKEYKEILFYFTPLLCCIEQISDFTESYFKRKFDVKDSGSIIPGHGGFLDRFDGFLFLTISFIMILNIFFY